MHRRPIRVLPAIGLTLAALATAGTPACAQAPGTLTLAQLTLAQVIDDAKAHYPAIKAARAQQQAAQGAIGLARTARLPRADILWQTNRATANNIYGLLLPQNVIPSISG